MTGSTIMHAACCLACLPQLAVGSPCTVNADCKSNICRATTSTNPAKICKKVHAAGRAIPAAQARAKSKRRARLGCIAARWKQLLQLWWPQQASASGHFLHAYGRDISHVGVQCVLVGD